MFINYTDARKKGGGAQERAKTQGPEALVHFLLEQTNLKSIYKRCFI